MRQYIVVALLLIIFITSCTTAQVEKKESFTIGISKWVSNPGFEENIQGFKDGLAQEGFIQGESIIFLEENSDTNKDQQVLIAQKFVEQEVDLIFSLTTPGTLIIKDATTQIPIVFSIVTFPVEAGVIDSLAHSGNNLVGTRNYVPASRQSRHFLKILPEMKKIAFVHREDEPNSKIQLEEFTSFLQTKDVEVIDIAATDIEDLHSKLSAALSDVDAAYAACDTLIQSGGEETVIELTMNRKIPTFTCNNDGVEKGSLLGAVADRYSIGKEAGIKAAKILQGANPSSLLTESSTKDSIYVNKESAQKLGITIPDSLLAISKETQE